MRIENWMRVERDLFTNRCGSWIDYNQLKRTCDKQRCDKIKHDTRKKKIISS